MIPFTTTSKQLSNPPRRTFSEHESKAITKELQHLLEIRAIVKCNPVNGQFLSDVFLVPKGDGTQRFIFNLKKLNKFKLSRVNILKWKTSKRHPNS